MRLSRHAKNRARFLKLTLLEIDRIVHLGVTRGLDPRGNRRVHGFANDGREIIAVDDPELVITLMERRPR